MPSFPLPNILIYLSALVRPRILRPDLRVPSIAHLDFRKLRQKGFNRVVVDKDNCLTLPNDDVIYQPLKVAWTDLLSAFPSGRVLVVSNSAGTKKDPGGIAAEAVSLSLLCPVLVHRSPKPGCSTSILSYFRGELPAPRTLRHEIARKGQELAEREQNEEDEVLDRWKGEVEDGLLLGPGPGRGEVGKKRLEKRMADRRVNESPNPNVNPNAAALDLERSAEKTVNEKAGQKAGRLGGDVGGEELRLAVIGDRLLTDTLLAHRLSLHLPPSNPGSGGELTPRVVSIHVTQLPEPRDVRFLRWIEERLSGGLTKGAVDLREVDRDTGSAAEIGLPKGESEGNKHDQKKGDGVHWDPRTWRPVPLLLGLGRGIQWTGGKLGNGVRWAWATARRRGAKLETEVEGVKGSDIA